ncbi:hypothetical protein N7488_002408 [Penicillium malachiteum]|nr:hypothetical protein N7488_002408 [Penicillium malachiteum]
MDSPRPDTPDKPPEERLPSKMKGVTERAHRHRMGEGYYIVDLDDARFSSDLLNNKNFEVFE